MYVNNLYKKSLHLSLTNKKQNSFLPLLQSQEIIKQENVMKFDPLKLNHELFNTCPVHVFLTCSVSV